MANKKTVKYSPANTSHRRPTRGPGRPKGSLNKVTVEAKAAAALIIDDPAYRENLLQRARTGQLSPAMEALMWAYAKGKPKEDVVSVETMRIVWDDSDEP